jgi:hypothetical protein
MISHGLKMLYSSHFLFNISAVNEHIYFYPGNLHNFFRISDSQRKIPFPLLYLEALIYIAAKQLFTIWSQATFIRFTFSFLRVHVEFLLVESKYLHNLEGGPPLLLDVTKFNTLLFLGIIL